MTTPGAPTGPTSTGPTSTDLAATDLAQRYGAPSRGRRLALATVVAVVAVAFLGWLGWTAFVHATPRVSSDLIGWEVVDDHEVVAQVDVALDAAAEDLGAHCRVTAFAADHTVVGELAWTPVAGGQEVTVRTERRATSVDLVGCTADGQSRPR